MSTGHRISLSYTVVFFSQRYISISSDLLDLLVTQTLKTSLRILFLHHSSQGESLPYTPQCCPCLLDVTMFKSKDKSVVHQSKIYNDPKAMFFKLKVQTHEEVMKSFQRVTIRIVLMNQVREDRKYQGESCAVKLGLFHKIWHQ